MNSLDYRGVYYLLLSADMIPVRKELPSVVFLDEPVFACFAYVIPDSGPCFDIDCVFFLGTHFVIYVYV